MKDCTQLDHLVVLASSLEQGVAWCEAALGITPDAGGRHAFMGTHNRLLRTSSDAFPNSYLEIIAIDPDGQPPTNSQRWFDTRLQLLLVTSSTFLARLFSRLWPRAQNAWRKPMLTTLWSSPAWVGRRRFAVALLAATGLPLASVSQ